MPEGWRVVPGHVLQSRAKPKSRRSSLSLPCNPHSQQAPTGRMYTIKASNRKAQTFPHMFIGNASVHRHEPVELVTRSALYA
jgi:hypothetical protein